MNSAFYEGETVYADGITNLPVGTELNVYVKSLDSAFTWSQLGTAVVYGPSAEDPEWNSWKVYVQPDGWACEKYEVSVADPGTGASKTLQFTIAPASEYSQQGGGGGGYAPQGTTGESQEDLVEAIQQQNDLLQQLIDILSSIFGIKLE